MALSYNSRNQLLSAAVGGVSGSFTYDAEGHRQSATHAGQTSTFTVNGSGAQPGSRAPG